LERRLGISVIETQIKLYFKIDSHLDTRQLLRFVTYMQYRHVSESNIIEPSDMTRDYFAYVTPADPDDDSRPVLSTAGWWLYDTSGGGLHDETSTIYFIPGSNTFHIRHLSEVDNDIKPVRMPLMQFVGPIFMPPDRGGVPLDVRSAQPLLCLLVVASYDACLDMTGSHHSGDVMNALDPMAFASSSDQPSSSSCIALIEETNHPIATTQFFQRGRRA
jgi:hypothetical protein